MGPQKKFSSHRSSLQCRRGNTMAEMLVAATLLVALLSFAAPTVIRNARIWQQTRDVQLAMDELSNQMERLLVTESDQISKAIDELKVSDEIAQVLVGAKIEVENVDDKDGHRLVLSINWDRVGPSVPITLVGWIATETHSQTAKEDVE